MEIEKDYYAILGVGPTATGEEIKKAFRALARRYHPDVSDAPDAAERFQEVQEAYEVLSDEALRKAYDKARAEAGLSDQAILAWELTVSRQSLPAIPEEQILYLMVEISPAAAMEAKRLPLNLCLVIDRSTSMQGERLNQVKAAAYQIIEDLRESDTFSVVTFSDRADVVLSGLRGSDKTLARARLNAIRASGGTEILKGLEAGVEQVKKRKRLRAVNHIILLTDGHTYGDEEACLALAVEARSQGIGISAMGIGEDWNDQFLDLLATKSGGVSAYVDSAAQVRSLLRKRVQGLGSIYAQDIQLLLRFASNVRLESAYKVSPYIIRLEPSQDRLSLGPLEAASPLSALLEIVVGPQKPGRHRLMQLEVTGDVIAVGRQGERLRRELWFSITENPTSEGEVPANLVNALNKVTIYRMQEQAYQALESGNAEKASEQLALVATRLLDIGELELAQAARLEAGRLARTGRLSPEGRKKLKYGTRSLTMGPVGGEG
ncbi:MAG: VWA domain-containing protein [Chloroflexi bacterium]|nr:MAG: VWA domain-containing protein [Chloroflexota bacterium]